MFQLCIYKYRLKKNIAAKISNYKQLGRTLFNLSLFHCRAVLVAKSASFWRLVKAASSNSAPLDGLAPGSQRSLCTALVHAGSASFQGEEKDHYWKMVS